MSKTFEVEVRGPLTQAQYDNVAKKLDGEGTYIETKERVLIDYSTFLSGEEMETRGTDIRLRVTNKRPEIIVKLGSWGGNEQREELSVMAEQGSFDTLVRIFGVMGYRKGMLCVRKSNVYKYKDIEFTLVEIPGNHYTYEAEKLITANADKDAATLEIKNICAELGLQVYSDQEFFNFVKKLNEEVNEVFEFEKYTDGYFKSRFSL